MFEYDPISIFEAVIDDIKDDLRITKEKEKKYTKNVAELVAYQSAMEKYRVSADQLNQPGRL
jgi:hypothetical protein